MRADVRRMAIRKEYEHFFARRSLGYAVRRSSALLSRSLNQELSQFDLTRNHWVILACLWRRDGLPVMFIAEQVQQVGGTLTGVLDRMEKRKLIKRRRDRKDRRIWRVWLTDEGQKLVHVLPARVQGIWKVALAGITKADLTRFWELLDRAVLNCCPGFASMLPECDERVPQELRDLLPPNSLGYRLKLLALFISRIFAERAGDYNVTACHWTVLCRLWLTDGIPTSQIGQYIEQEGGTLAGVLERMEERGVIRRQQDAKDRRCTRVWLTEQGEDLIEVLPPIAQGVLDTVCGGMTSVDVDFFQSINERIIVNLSTR